MNKKGGEIDEVGEEAREMNGDRGVRREMEGDDGDRDKGETKKE